MSGLEYKITVPRRQAMVNEIIVESDEYGVFEHRTGKQDKVLVWPIPTKDGEFVVEYEEGYCGRVKPERLKFLDSKEIFYQYDWSESADSIRHYHETTVEDMLQEIVHKCQPTYSKDGSYTTGLTEEELAEYASKLRLAGDGEEQ